MSRSIWISVSLIVLTSVPSYADQSTELADAAKRIRSEFARLDRNGDRQIDLKEFRGLASSENGPWNEATTGPENRELAISKRDFVLYDFDSNGVLSRSEFACVPGLVDAPLRGSMPDPWLDLLDDAVAALDQSYDRWDQRPKELVSAHTFIGNFLDSITPGGKRFVTGRIVDQADQNSDSRISRDEARHFLEQQLGSRLHHGPPLRSPTGLLLRYDRFLEMDQDHSRTISMREFDAGWWGAGPSSDAFARLDRDKNASLKYSEYAAFRSGAFFDSVLWFRRADTNLDASLSREELLAAVEPARHHLIESSLLAFDDDHDGNHSLNEFRLSILSQYNYPWHRRPPDEDRDGRLSYDEFDFDDVDLFQLQKLFFFSRLDLNGDGELSTAEFPFQEQEPLAIRAYPLSGRGSKLLYRSPKFPNCGSPSVSPDGTQVLFHQAPSTGLSDGTIVVVSLEGDVARVLCSGIRPTWSPDGAKFACERRDPDSGIWIIDASGLRGERVASGHSPKWSPDGKSLAFLDDNGVSILDLKGGEVRRVLLREDHPFRDLGHDIAWSPDSRRLALFGSFAATSQMLLLDIMGRENADVHIRFSFDYGLRGPLSWSEREGIVFAAPDSNQTRILSLQPDAKSPPKLVERFRDIGVCRSACLTPDEQWYVVVTAE